MSKLIFVMTLLLTVFSVQAEVYECQSKDHRWQVLFDLQDVTLSELTFTKDGELKHSFSKVLGSKKTLRNDPKTEIFEFNLGGVKYFNFKRRTDSDYVRGGFLLKQNPLAHDIEVSCVKL